MAEVEMKHEEGIETGEFTEELSDELSDEALDRDKEPPKMCACTNVTRTSRIDD